MMASVSTLNTLQFDQETCNGCGLCVDVCPHGVFARNSRMVHVAHPEDCMECGACQTNCAFGAVKVESGVGCAASMIYAALRGRPQTECTCG